MIYMYWVYGFQYSVVHIHNFSLLKRHFALYFIFRDVLKNIPSSKHLSSSELLLLVQCKPRVQSNIFCLENAMLQFESCRFCVLSLQVSTVQCSLLAACCVLFLEVSNYMIGRRRVLSLALLPLLKLCKRIDT